MTLDTELALVLGLTFLAAGTLKGVIGLGFPTVVLGVLTTVIGLKSAIAVLLIPAVLTNAWQVVDSRHGKALLARFWPMFAGIVPGIWLGTGILAASTGTGPALFLGLLITLHALVSLARPDLPHPGRHEPWMTPASGLINGVVTGLTGSSIMPGVLYFQAIGLKKEEMVGAMGLIFGSSTLLLAIFLARYGLLTGQLVLISLAALVPSFAGLRLGALLRRRLSEERFKRALLVGLALLGVYVMLRAAGGL